MLRKVSNKEVRGPSFSISVPDIHRVLYSEGAKVASVGIEGGTNSKGEVNWLVYSQTLRAWEAPHQMDEMSPKKRAEILDHISQAMNLLEMPHEIV